MKILADYHTHTKNSRFFHGKNKIEEMVISANEMGLVEIGITDHGYFHLFRTNKKKLRQARKEIDEINTWSKTKVLLGIEADIIAEDGTLDIDNETLSMLDILIVGYHKMIKTDFAGFFGHTNKSKEAIQKCTNAYINAIKKYPVTIVAHLDSILKTDLYEIGKVCKERGTMVEINNRHMRWTKEQVEDLIASDCMFVVSSDAHNRNDIGDVEKAFEIIRKYQIPSENVANVEFLESEKSEADREASVYYSIYLKQKEEKEQKQKEIEKKKLTEFTETLSPEMEKALRDIANENGLQYKEKIKEEETQEKEEDDSFTKFLLADSEELIKRNQEYINTKKLEETMQENETIESVQTEVENNLVQENVEDKILNEKIEENFDKKEDFDDSNEFGNNNIAKLLKNAKTENKLEEEPKQVKNDVLSENEVEKEIKEEKPVKETLNERPDDIIKSITRKNLASVGVEEKVAVKEQPKPQTQTRKVVGRRGFGGFVDVNNIVDNEKRTNK